MSIQAYQRAATQAESPKEIEYRVLGAVTAALVRAAETGPVDIAERVRAIHDNRRLWMVFANDCAQPSNALSPEVRARIISLSLFVFRHSSAVLREGADIQTLIDINQSMMEGVKGR